MKKSNGGFANVLLLSLLPFLIGAFLLAHLCIGLIQLEMKLNHLSRQSQIEIQKKVRKNLEKLMLKNVKATALQVEYYTTMAAMAIPGGSTPAAAAKLMQIRKKREVLDQEQKVLIKATDSLLYASSNLLYARLRSEGAAQANTLASMVNIEFTTKSPARTYFAVEPVTPDIAPVYRTKSRFSELQALEQTWQYKIRMKSPLNRFLAAEAKFQRASIITLVGKGLGWELEIVKDRSWLKRLSSSSF